MKCFDHLWRMTRGPAYFESKGACIYCGATDVKLSDEHIVPYSLGGAHVLRDASCFRCANITKKFEQKVARDLWGDARTAFNAPTRRRQERRSHITISHPDDPAKKVTVPAGEYPAGLVFYKMSQAGLLQGMPETIDISSSWQMVVIDDDKRRQRFLERHPGSLLIRFQERPGCIWPLTGEDRLLPSADYARSGRLPANLPSLRYRRKDKCIVCGWWNVCRSGART